MVTSSEARSRTQLLHPKNSKSLANASRRLLRLAAVCLVALAPVAVYGHGGGGGGGHGGGGGGHMGGGGGHMGGGGFSGGSFHGGGFSGGGMHYAPSHSFAPSHSIAPGVSRMPSINGATGGAHSAFRVPTSGSGAIGNTARATTSWNHASHAQLQHVNSNLSSALKGNATANAAVNHGLTSAHIAGNAATGAKLGGLSSQGSAIRGNWNANMNHHCMNGSGWWTGRHIHGFGGFGLWGGFGYSPWLSYYPWWYWWGNPGWGYCNSYLGYGGNNGYYYGYGANGNVVYQNGQVLVDGQAVGTDTEYAQSAAELANVSAEDLKAVKPADWLPLGTFSWAIKDEEVDPSRVIQFAVSKDGLISGTVHNRTSGNTYSVQGRVDKETQRLAFTIGDDRNTVLETGIFNLTQDQTPVLCHFGLSETQTYMFVRLPEPEHEPGPALPGIPPANEGANPPAPPAPGAPDAAAAPVPADAAPVVAADSRER